MALNSAFRAAVEELRTPGMGTENVGPLLYALVRMTRSWRLMEVGLGYTTPFLAKALKDMATEFEADRTLLSTPGRDERKGVLSVDYYRRNHMAILHAIDDYSVQGSSAPKVLETLKHLELDMVVELHDGDYRGMSRKIDPATLPLDLVWFDCGGLIDYVDFIEEFWPLINADGGMLLLHYTYWDVAKHYNGTEPAQLIPNPIANEIKRQQARAGVNAEFEVLSLLEPHKTRQGSVTVIRKLNRSSMVRDAELEEDLKSFDRDAIRPLPKL